MVSTIGFTTCVMGTWEILLSYVSPFFVLFHQSEGLPGR